MRRGAIAAALLAAALTVSPTAGAAPAPAGNPDSHCQAGKIRAAIVSFTRAFNRGDREKLEAIFAPEPEFAWFSSPGPGRRLLAPSQKRSTLPAYFAARHAKHDHLTLTRFDFSHNSPRWGNFGFTMRRSADGFMQGNQFLQEGKGAAVCDSAGTRLIVFTFGRPERPR